MPHSPVYRRYAAAILALPLLAACGVQPAQVSTDIGGAAALAQAQPPQAPPAATPAQSSTALTPVSPAAQLPAAAATAPAAPVPGGTLVFQITDDSKATFRVREQLAGRSLPNDAVGSTKKVTGQIAINPDGALAQDSSKITVDMTSLATDSGQRDNFIKNTTLATRQFPTATFVPTRAEGLPSPLPASGEYSFKLTGLLTIHGVQKETTWDVTARRDGGTLAGTATTSFTFGDFGMTPPKAPAVLSVVDEIRLEVALTAALAG